MDELEFAETFFLVVTRLARWQRSESTKLSPPIPVAMLSILSSLDRLGPATPTELALREKIQKPSITRLLSALEARDLVARDDHPSDGRQSVVSITQTGVDELRVRRATIVQLYLELVSCLAPKDTKAIMAAMPALTRLTRGIG